MALRFAKLSRTAVRSMPAGAKITEHGITAERLANGDVAYSVNIMVDGERIHRTAGRESEGVTREQAERMIETLRTRAREERLNLPKGRKTSQSFADAAPLYVERLEREGGKGIPRKRQHITTSLIPAFGNCRLDGISETLIKTFIQSRRRAKAKDSTINRELATLSHLLRCAARWKWIGRDKIPTIDRLREGAGRIIALSPDQCAALLHGAVEDQDPDLWLFIMICLQTSMRHGEARRLRWEHYDAHRRRFYIPEAKAGEREQPVPTQLAEALEAVMEDRRVSSGYVFAGGPGSKTGYRHTFRKAFARAADRAGLDPAIITPHVMRHTAITKLVKAGIDLPTVQRVSGHKTLAMVLRYTHIDGPHIDSAVNHLGFAAVG
ncbi:site-specific integrase [Sphingomonas faeni]|uniref:tyrosine-type recombinase/integrase n=1 Tax=Sphingomonas faeni TaxID=185950 RepID=UPI00334F060E